MIGMFTRIVSKFSIPISQAVYMFKAFLMPKLELALHYVHGPGTAKWIQSCNGLLMGCIKHAASSHLKLSHTTLVSLGLHLPSWMEASVKVSELFLRINSHDARWGHVGRLVLRQGCTTRQQWMHPPFPIAQMYHHCNRPSVYYCLSFPFLPLYLILSIPPAQPFPFLFNHYSFLILSSY